MFSPLPPWAGERGVIREDKDVISALAPLAAAPRFARAVAGVLSHASSWGRIAGVHVHIWPAAEQVKEGDVIIVDGGETTTFFAEELAGKENITVITNSVPVFEALSNQSGITLISTGGSLRRATETLIGPTAEAALRELRADKLFLDVSRDVHILRD